MSRVATSDMAPTLEQPLIGRTSAGGNYCAPVGSVLYRLVADGVVVAHFAFIVFVAVGGLMAWRWPRLLWLQPDGPLRARSSAAASAANGR